MDTMILLAILLINTVTVFAQKNDPLLQGIPETEGVASPGTSAFLEATGKTSNELHHFMLCC